MRRNDFGGSSLWLSVTACHWDKVIDLQEMWTQFKRLIQPKRAIVLTATQPFTTDLIVSNREWFKYCWVWEKSIGNNFLMAKKQPLRKHEDVLIFGEGELLYNPQFEEGTPYIDKPRKRSHRVIDSTIPNLGIVNEGTRFPSSVISISNSNNNCLHPTQKPIALFEYLIKTYTNPGDVVLDPTAGSMTTAIACLQTGRQYVCIEQDPDYYRKGCDRVQAWHDAPKQVSLLSEWEEKQQQPKPEQLSLVEAS